MATMPLGSMRSIPLVTSVTLSRSRASRTQYSGSTTTARADQIGCGGVIAATSVGIAELAFEEGEQPSRARLLSGLTAWGSLKSGSISRDVGDAVERAGAGAHEVGVERQVAVEPVDLRRERRPVARAPETATAASAGTR